jgi:ubiquitin-small subunit ribosomal protein S27Ae
MGDVTLSLSHFVLPSLFSFPWHASSSGKIQRLRRECPAKSCGAGVFMAKHENRHYCGKCHLTYVFEAAAE